MGVKSLYLKCLVLGVFEMLIFFSSLELFVYLILQIFEPGARNVIDIWVNVHQSNDKICQDLTL